MKTFIIGRNPKVSQGEIPIFVHDHSKVVSSNHCRIFFDGVHYFIEDLISVNGIYVDGVKISNKTIVTFNSRITLGEHFPFSLKELQMQDENDSKSRISNKIESKETYEFAQRNDYGYENNMFFNFFQPIIKKIDNGSAFKKPIIWLFTINAIFSLIAPLFYLIYYLLFFKNSIYMNSFSMIANDDISAAVVFGIIIIFLFFVFAGWISFQIYWYRKNQIDDITYSNDIYVMPLLSHIFKTNGEVLGVTIGILGFGVSFIALIFDIEYDYLPLGMVLFPLLGYIIFFIFRYIAERIKVLASIAYNTKNN